MSKSFVVTGASSGIGRDIARDLIAHGCHVFGSVRKATDGQALQAEFGEAFTPLHFDVCDEAAIRAAVEKVRGQLGDQGLAGLVNNAGVGPCGPLMHMPMDDFQRLFDINVAGLLRVTQAFLPLLGAGQSQSNAPGRIVNISSISGRVTVPMAAAYAASKHAVEALSDGMRRELSIYGVHVAVVEPGPTRTSIWDKASTEAGAGDYAAGDYAESMRALLQMAEREAVHGRPVSAVSAVVRHALLSDRPKARYPMEPIWFISKFLPTALLDRALCKKAAVRPRRSSR